MAPGTDAFQWATRTSHHNSGPVNRISSRAAAGHSVVNAAIMTTPHDDAETRLVFPYLPDLTVLARDVPQLEDIEFIPCAGRLADRRVPFAAAQ